MSLEPTLWIVGDWNRAEFGKGIAWLDSRTKSFLFADADAAVASWRAVEGTPVPTAIVLAQSRPGQISHRDVERLHAAAPLARLVALVGAWCEGELRSGEPWPGVDRVPVSAWRFGLERELALMGGNGCLAAPLPRTATAAEKIESVLSELWRESTRGIRAIVVSHRRANYEAIADMLQRLGIESIWQCDPASSGTSAEMVVFDGWEQVSSHSRPPSHGQHGNSPMRVLLLHFPREEDYARAAREGIREVLALPLSLSDLAAALDSMMGPAAGPQACA